MKLLSPAAHYRLYFWILIIFATAIHWSLFMMGAMTVALVVCWLLQPNLKESIQTLYKRPSIFLFSAAFFLVLVGFLNTGNTKEWHHVFRIYLPMFIIPMILGTTTTKLKQIDFKELMFWYIISTLASSIFNLSFFFYRFGTTTDLRQISFFVSHIRYSLFINVAIFSSYYYLFLDPITSKFKQILLYISIIWLSVFIFILQSITGIAIFLILFSFTIAHEIYSTKKITHRIIAFLLFCLPVGIIAWMIISNIYQFSQTKEIPANLREAKTPYGNNYMFYIGEPIVENGHFVCEFVCEKELEETWNSISSYHYNGLDKKKQCVNQTLIRYLASKNLRKDHDGVLQLNPKDISNIENGLSNYRLENKFSLNSRIYQIIWELDRYRKGGNPSGNSVTQRFEFWHCSLSIISHNLLIGVGSGDLSDTKKEYYKKINTKLSQEKWFDPHNEFLTITIRTGLLGLCVFIIGFIASIYLEKRQTNFLMLVYVIIILTSMINEDTLETPFGIVLYAFFGSLFMYVQPNKAVDSSDIKQEDIPIAS